VVYLQNITFKLNTAISKQGLETETNTVRDHITRRHLPNLRDLTEIRQNSSRDWDQV